MTIMEDGRNRETIDHHYLKEARLAKSHRIFLLVHSGRAHSCSRIRSVQDEGGRQCGQFADAYYAPLHGSFVRHCFDRALRGDFGFLDGVVFMNGCDHTRRMYDNWRYSKTGPEFLHMFFAPHVMGGNAAGAFRESMANLKKALEKSFGVTIADDSLRNSIRLYSRIAPAAL